MKILTGKVISKRMLIFVNTVLLLVLIIGCASENGIYSKSETDPQVSAGEPGAFTVRSNQYEITDTSSAQILWEYSSGANNYSVYESNRYFTSVTEPGVTRIASGITNVWYFRDYSFSGIFFYRVVAFNNNGNTTSSNYLQFNVSLVNIYRVLHDGTTFENAQKICHDDDGNIFVADTQGHGGIPYRDLTISKYHKNGTLQWRSGYITDEHSFGLACDTDSSGNSFGAGYITVSSKQYMLLAKFSASGTFQWNRTKGGGTSATARGVAVDSNDNIILAGYIAGTTNDIMLVKYNSAGTEQWTKTWDSGGADYATDITVDSSNNIYLVGYTNGKGAGGYDALIIKYDSNGNEQWNQTWGTTWNEGTYDSGQNSIALDIQNNIYITTARMSGSDVGTLTSRLVKFDSDGDYLWNVTENLSSSEEHLNDLEVDGEGNIFVCGYYYYSSTYKTDSVVFMYNSSGTKLWTHEYCTTSYENSESITLANGYAYMTGKEWVWIISLAPRPFRLTETADNPDTNGIFDLTWTSSSRCKNYSLYYSTSFFNWTEVGNRGDIFCIDSGLTNLSYALRYIADGNYCYRLLSYNFHGNSTSNYVGITVENVPPGSFTLSSNAGSPYDRDGNVDITWTSSVDATTYNIYEWSTPITEYNGSLNVIAEGLTGLSYHVEGLGEGPHYIAVTANNHIGYTLSTNYINCTTQFGKPNPFTLVVDTPDGIYSWGNWQLDWTYADGADNYSIWYSPYPQEYNWEISKLMLDNGISGTTLDYAISMLYCIHGWGAHFQIEAKNEYGSTLSNNDGLLFNYKAGWNYYPYAIRIRTDAGVIDVDGNFSLIWTQMTTPLTEPANRTDYYDIYMNDTNFIENDRYAESTLICSHATNSSLDFHNFADGVYYFRIVAVNLNGIRVSACIAVRVFNYDMPELTATHSATSPEYDGIVQFSWNAAESSNFSIYSYATPITSINSSLTLVKENITDGLAYTCSNLADGAKYYVVVAKHMYGDIISNNMYINVFKSAPTTPSLSSNAGNPDYDGSFTLSWSATQYTDNYTVYYHTAYITTINETVDVLASGITDLSYPTSVLTSGKHYFKVVAFNRLGNGTSACLTIQTLVMIPEKPTLSSNAGSPDGDGNYRLQWTSAVGAANYTVYRYSAPITEINGSLEIISLHTTGLFFDIFSADEAVHYYAVTANNPLGMNLSNCIGVTVYYPRPGAFSLSIWYYENPDSDGSYGISWSYSDHAEYYNVYMASHPFTSISGDVELIYSNIHGQMVEFHAIGTGTYYYAVLAVNDYGTYFSGSVTIQVHIPGDPDPNPDPDPDPNNWWIFLILGIGAVAGIGIIVVKKKSPPSPGRKSDSSAIKPKSDDGNSSSSSSSLGAKTGQVSNANHIDTSTSNNSAIPREEMQYSSEQMRMQQLEQLEQPQKPQQLQQPPQPQQLPHLHQLQTQVEDPHHEVALPAALPAYISGFYCGVCNSFPSPKLDGGVIPTICETCKNPLSIIIDCPHCMNSQSIPASSFVSQKEKGIQCTNCQKPLK